MTVVCSLLCGLFVWSGGFVLHHGNDVLAWALFGCAAYAALAAINFIVEERP